MFTYAYLGSVYVSWRDCASLEFGLSTGVVVEKGHNGIHSQVQDAVGGCIAGCGPVLPQVAQGIHPEALNIAGPVDLFGLGGVFRLEMGLVNRTLAFT